MIQKNKGWVLDVYIEDNEAILWVKTEEEKVLKLFDNYEPVFYIQPKNENCEKEIFQILQDLELVKEIGWDYKLIDTNSRVKEKLLYVRCLLIHHYNLLLKVLQHETLQRRINQLFNTKLSHIQRYLFAQLRIQPTTKVQIEHEDGELISIIATNDNEDLQLPFSTMQIEVVPFTEQEVLDTDDPIKCIKVSFNSVDIDFEDDESTILEQFFNYIKTKDPDVLIFRNHNLNVLNYLLERTMSLSLDLQLGRKIIDIYALDQKKILELWSQGRIYLTNNHLNDGLAGLLEISYFSYLPIRIATRYSIGRLIANRNLYELLGRGYVISDNNNQRTHEQIRTVEEIIDRDKAGMIFSPQVGLHENVAVLDYNDEFANIIVNNNISYEKAQQIENNSHLGILPNIVKTVLERRVRYKKFLKELPQDSPEAKYCEQRVKENFGLSLWYCWILLE